MKINNWFEVDKTGLKQLLYSRGKAFAIAELVQNAWDQNITKATITIEKVGRGLHSVAVEDDDPNGWEDITDAYTLFASSKKKSDPTKRGRFNLGEKLVLAVCKEAEIVSVNSAVRFDTNGRKALKKRTKEGSRFTGLMELSNTDVAEFKSFINTLLLPKGIITEAVVCGERFILRPHTPVYDIEINLPTLISDAEGNMKRSNRNTVIELYEVEQNEEPMIYEMGIPVVPLSGDKWHINVMQKIPLNMDRDNVTPSYLAQLRVSILNACVEQLDENDMTDTWVTSAASDERCDDETIKSVLTSKYGEKRVAYDPSDHEANHIAVSQGYTVVHGGSMSSGMWENTRRSNSMKPSGQVTPSAKVWSDDPNAPSAQPIPKEKWSKEMNDFAEFAFQLHKTLIGRPLTVRMYEAPNNFQAGYGSNLVKELQMNLTHLEENWFEPNKIREQVDLLIHEFGHYYSGNHLSEEYYQGLSKLGAGLALHLVSCSDDDDIKQYIKKEARS